MYIPMIRGLIWIYCIQKAWSLSWMNAKETKRIEKDLPKNMQAFYHVTWRTGSRKSRRRLSSLTYSILHAVKIYSRFPGSCTEQWDTLHVNSREPMGIYMLLAGKSLFSFFFLFFYFFKIIVKGIVSDRFSRPSVLKLVKLLSINNEKELWRLGKFLQQATILRNEQISII